MKANEFRLGNYVNYQGRAQKICALNMNSLKIGELAYDDHRETLSNILIKPIPLTEEWLLKFGFEYFKANNSYQLDTNLGFCIWGRIKDGFMIFVNSDEIGIKITTVHQLQNLYFALTNKELTRKTLA